MQDDFAPKSSISQVGDQLGESVLGSDFGGLGTPSLQKCGAPLGENAPTEAVMFEAPKRPPGRSSRWLRSLIPS